jgi:glycosyltransferase involved in cell wall biosynthesis
VAVAAAACRRVPGHEHPAIAQAGGWPRISVVVPALNEAANLEYVFSRFSADDEVVLVDGHSTDGTIETARRLRPDVRIVRQTERGKGNALRCGFAACSGDIVVMLDADGSTDPAEIPRFVEALLSGADCAKGTRFAKGGKSHDITALRAGGNWLLVRLVNLLFRTTYSDLCYGYNAFWSDCLHVIHPDCQGFEVETLINVRLARAGLHVVEVPSVEGPRLHGASKLKTFSDGWRVLRTILRERFHPADGSLPSSAGAGRPWTAPSGDVSSRRR